MRQQEYTFHHYGLEFVDFLTELRFYPIFKSQPISEIICDF